MSEEAFPNLFEVLISQGSIKTHDELSDIQSAVIKDLGGEIILWKEDKNQKFTKEDLLEAYKQSAYDGGWKDDDEELEIFFEKWFERTFPVLV